MAEVEYRAVRLSQEQRDRIEQAAQTIDRLNSWAADDDGPLDPDASLLAHDLRTLCLAWELAPVHRCQDFPVDLDLHNDLREWQVEEEANARDLTMERIGGRTRRDGG